MGVLAVYDTVGIQNYIFATNKLAENVGGSKLLKDVFQKLLPAVMEEVTKEERLEWEHGKELVVPQRKAEIVYQGGGNAYVAFKNEEEFHKITEAFLIEVNKTAPGIGIAVAAVKTDFTDKYQEDFKNLNGRLAYAKGGFNIPVFAGNQPITKQSIITGTPVDVYNNTNNEDEYFNSSQKKKRDRYREYQECRGSDIRDFDDLAFEKGTDSLIAIIHADGNNMGKQITEFMGQANLKDYKYAVPAIRQLSSKIDACYKAARDKTKKAFYTERQDTGTVPLSS